MAFYLIIIFTKTMNYQKIYPIIFAGLLFGCKGNSKEATDQQITPLMQETSASAAPSITEDGVRIPQLMMPGPIDPIPAADDVLFIAHIGRFSSIDELHKSPFYPQLVSCYPELSKIDKLTVDIGRGDLWLLRPRAPMSSLAINEYSMRMFTGEQDQDSGKVYYRTEEASPILIRMTADDPGSVSIAAVDNDGHILSWIPTMTPSDNMLRLTNGVQDFTYNPLSSMLEMGKYYNSGDLSIRFYGDKQLRLGDSLGTYYAFHMEKGGIGLWFKVGDKEGVSTISLTDSGDGIILIPQNGYDFGQGLGKRIVFQPE